MRAVVGRRDGPGSAGAQPLAGLVRDLTGNPAMPIVFAAGVMALTAVGLAIFRFLERWARPA